jgi:hypothetical protein
MIHALIGVFFFFLFALPDGYAMQETKMTILKSSSLSLASHFQPSL